MISECLADLHKPTNLAKQFELPAHHNQPSLMICNDKRRNQNKAMEFHILDNRPVPIANVNGEMVFEIFNTRNLTNSAGSLQEGYSRNIDIDSELKRINHYTDKCFYDNYKINPRDVSTKESSLAIHRNVLVHDYQIKRYPEPNKCMPSSAVRNAEFQECPYMPNVSSYKTSENEPVYYNFNNENYICDYPCNKLFNNTTKRSMLANNKNFRGW
jgi:hypothetical protein